MSSSIPGTAPEPTAEHPHTQGTIEADSFDDTTSDYATSIESETTSLASSIFDHVYENGRRYHRYQEGKYALPNDESEQDRLDLYHHIFLLMSEGQLTYAPIKNPQRILDVGTGTGIWALDCAETWPSAEVIGTDLSPIQPAWTFPNCRFEIDDCELEWTYKENYFDLIHSRSMLSAIRDWPRYLEQMYRSTKPGGYIEIVEVKGDIESDDGTLNGTGVDVWINVWRDAMEKAGLPHIYDTHFIKFMKDAGFVDVQCYTKKLPLNAWPKDKNLKEVGRCMMLNTQGLFHAYGVALFTRVLGMSAEEATKICDDAKRDASKTKVHGYNYCWWITARKPENDA